VLQVEGAPGMHPGDFSRIDECPDLVLKIGPPVEVVLPKDCRNAGMGQDMRIGLFDLPVICEHVELMTLLRRAILVRPVAQVVVLHERYSTILPRKVVSRIADHADTIARSEEHTSELQSR